ncbi:DedA family protein [Candidatus Woesearchaeota archaeon]|nr:DedA family protein [Candidatus Woesearchaeota archaeon]
MAILDALLTYVSHLSYLAIIVLLVLSSIGIPFPEDIILLVSGYVASLGILQWQYAVLACLAGVLLGDVTGYYIGRHGGWLLKRFLSKERFLRVEDEFIQRGPKIILFSRVLSGIRVFFPIAAGATRMPFWTFLVYDAIAAVVWVPLVFGIGHLVGTHFSTVAAWFKRADVMVVIAVLLAIGAFFAYRALRRQARQKVDERKKAEMALSAGENPLHKLIFGDIKKSAQVVLAKTREDRRVKVWVEFFRRGKRRKAISLREWVPREKYNAMLRQLSRKVGKPSIGRWG